MNRSRDPRIPTGTADDDGLVLAWEQASGGYVLVEGGSVEVAPYCKVKLSELLIWNNGTFLDFDTVVSDASGMLTAADTFTMPRAGRWLAHLHMHIDGGSGWASLVRNTDTTDAFGARQYIEDGPPNSFTFLITVEEGDEISVFNDYGGTIYVAGEDYDPVQGTAIEFLYLGPA